MGYSENMSIDIKNYIRLSDEIVTEEEAIRSFSKSLEALTNHVQIELKEGTFDREKVRVLLDLLAGVVQEYDFLSHQKDILH